MKNRVSLPETSQAKRLLVKRIVYSLLVLALLPVTAVLFSRLNPVIPSVEKATVQIANVRNGKMTLGVQGEGKLEPFEVRWIPAITNAVVERRYVEPGTPVKPDTLLLELSNPELEQAALDAEIQLKAADARLVDLRMELQSQQMTQEAAVARADAEYQQAKLRAETDAELARQGLAARLNDKLSALVLEQLSNQRQIEKRRLEMSRESINVQLAIQQSEVDRLHAQMVLKRHWVEKLHVRAGLAGVVQQISVQVGQQVSAGSNLAQVAQLSKLKAELKISEDQTKDLQVGQKAIVDTHNGLVRGRVVRIDPVVINKRVNVDVMLDAPFPKGVRPDLSVEGFIEVSHLSKALYIDGSLSAQENSTLQLYKLNSEGTEAVRVPVKVGRRSPESVEILEGLQAGDRVILSNSPANARVNRIRLN